MVRPFSLRPKITLEAAAALAVTLLAPLLYFFPATVNRLVLCPDDGVIFNVPLRVAAARIILDGNLPLWNPYIFGGMPLHGAVQAGILFPLNWFYLLFSAPVAANLSALSTYALAALGAYLYARRSGATLAGAFVTSLVWQWSGFLVAQLGHINIIQTAALLPWLMWAIDAYGATGARRRGALLAALVALQFFAGHQQTFAYTILLAAAYAAWMARAEREMRRAYLMSLALMLSGLALAAVQILPTLELMRNSLRSSASYDFFTSFSLPPRFFLTFFAPYVLGGGDGQLFRAPYTGAAFYGEYIGYVGLATLMLAALPVLLRRDARTKFWAVAALVCFVLALGRFVPFNLYKLIYHIPVLNLFRVPARHMMEVDFALAVLAGRAVSFIPALRERLRTKLAALGACACVLLLTCLAVTLGRPTGFRLGREAPVTLLRAPELFMPVVVAVLSAWAVWSFTRGRRRSAIVLLVAVIAFDLNLWGQSSGWRHSPPREDALWSEPATVKFLRAQQGAGQQATGEPYRILTMPQPFAPAGSASTSNLDPNEFVLSLQPDTYMMHGIANAAGYDGFGLARYSRLAGEMKIWGELPDPQRSLGESREFDLLNVRYLLTRNGQPVSPDTSKTAATATIPPAALPVAPTQIFGGYAFAAENLNAPALDKGKRLFLNVPRIAADQIALLTNLSWSLDVPDSTPVARLRLRTEDGRTFEFALLAGEHTSEWAYDRPDIRRRIKHKRAPVATSYAVVDAQSRYEAHTFVAAFTFPEKAIITGGEIEVATYVDAPDLGLNVQRVSLIDKGENNVVPLRREWLSKASASPQAQGSGERWRRAGEVGNVSVYENLRALPRAWLATEAVALPDESALETIRTGRLPGGRQWNPRTTVLVEALPEGSGLKGADDDDVAIADMAAREVQVKKYEPNRITLAFTSDAPAMLVLSENHYPGWRARLDGRGVETLRVDYNLRGVVVPAGAHELEFVYRPKSALLGLVVSLLTAFALFIWMKGKVGVKALRPFSKMLPARRGAGEGDA